MHETANNFVHPVNNRNRRLEYKRVMKIVVGSPDTYPALQPDGICLYRAHQTRGRKSNGNRTKFKPQPNHNQEPNQARIYEHTQ